MVEGKFSIDPAKEDTKELSEAAKLAENYFKSENDPEQISINFENSLWIRKNLPYCLNIIRYDGKIIGHSLIIPCKRKIMGKFISNEINEAQLFDEIKKSEENRKPECIYLCSAFIKPEFRGRGIVFESFIKSINKVIDKKQNLELFYWAYSNEGASLCEKIAKKLRVNLAKRKG